MTSACLLAAMVLMACVLLMWVSMAKRDLDRLDEASRKLGEAIRRLDAAGRK